MNVLQVFGVKYYTMFFYFQFFEAMVCVRSSLIFISAMWEVLNAHQRVFATFHFILLICCGL